MEPISARSGKKLVSAEPPPGAEKDKSKRLRKDTEVLGGPTKTINHRVSVAHSKASATVLVSRERE